MPAQARPGLAQFRKGTVPTVIGIDVVKLAVVSHWLFAAVVQLQVHELYELGCKQSFAGNGSAISGKWPLVRCIFVFRIVYRCSCNGVGLRVGNEIPHEY